MANKRRYKPDDPRVILACLSYSKVIDQANYLGVAVNTLNRYKQDPAFKKAMQASLNGILNETEQRLTGNLASYLDVLEKIANNKESSDQVRINAVQQLINTTMKFIELGTITARLEALEHQEDDLSLEWD